MEIIICIIIWLSFINGLNFINGFSFINGFKVILVWNINWKRYICFFLIVENSVILFSLWFIVFSFVCWWYDIDFGKYLIIFYIELVFYIDNLYVNDML